jgi:8-hydroxy-5-deazaflavin:NADPH oxidoreductase
LAAEGLSYEYTKEAFIKEKLKIGVIGAGNIGGALTRHFTRLGHDVVVANSRGPQSLAGLAKETGAKAVTTAEAPRGRDLAVVTIPERKIPDLPPGFFKDATDNLIVIDTGNYYPRQRDGRIEGIENGLPESRWVEQQLGHPVIKVFNNIYAEHLEKMGKPPGTPGRIALPVAGDNAKAKAVVIELVNDMGFDAVDAGRLDESWRQQPGTPVYTADLNATGVREALRKAKPERKPEWRATPNSPGTFQEAA